jgi:hypothetical protein
MRSLLSLILLLWFHISACSQQKIHPKDPQPGTYKSSMMSSWLTTTPKTDGDASKTKYNQIDFGVGSLSMPGLFGDLIFELRTAVIH